MNGKGGYFLKEDIAAFDAPFFSVSTAEANSMDPQQRMLLESVFEATENAGIPIESIAGTDTSCYVACFGHDWNDMLGRDLETGPLYAATGKGDAILSNRISHFYDLRGPSMTLDTACSSSLVALHLACQSLRMGESKTAIVGAANVILMPDNFITMSNLHFMSPDSQCHSFDDRANGYARGEGVATLVLKPLSHAVRNKDTIRAVIRATASNQDGRTTGITLPNREAQEHLISGAYTQAGCDPASVGYFESHGTGTAAGDPVEAKAIGAALGRWRSPGEQSSLYIGSVKTNIGHLEGASGLAGIIKTVMALEKGLIPPNADFKVPNQHIDFEHLRLQVATKLMPWPTTGLRRASVNSFGYGGTNAHVILDDAMHYLHTRRLPALHRTYPTSAATKDLNVCQLVSDTYIEGAGDDGYVSASRSDDSGRNDEHFRLVIFSAHEEFALQAVLQAYCKGLPQREDLGDPGFIENLAFTLGQRRSRFPWRTFRVVRTGRELVSYLRGYPEKFARTLSTTPRLAFIFTGQGAQWWGMGRQLLHLYPIFRRTIQAADTVVRTFGSAWSLFDELCRDEDESRINEAEISQPLCTAVQLALVDLLADWGVQPVKVVGHSSGEIAAAYTIGALPLASAMKVAFYRGLYASKLKYILRGSGAMLAVGISEESATTRLSLLDRDTGIASVACVNSPCSVTLSGDEGAIAYLEGIFKKEGIFARRLRVDAAYHSHHTLAIAYEYLVSLAKLEVVDRHERKSIDMISTVTGTSLTCETLSAEYWVQNMVSCVRFSDAIRRVYMQEEHDGPVKSGNSVDILIEIGPHPALSSPMKQILAALPAEKQGVEIYPTLIKGKDATERMLHLAGSLLVHGCMVDLAKVNFPTHRSFKPQLLVDLPSYPWNHSKRYWHESRLSRDHRFRKYGRHDLLGAPVDDWNPIEPRWRNFLRLHEQPWLKDHRVQCNVVYPCTGYICMALEAMGQLQPTAARAPLAGFVLRELSITRALIVPPGEVGVETMFYLRPFSASGVSSSNRWKEFRVFSWLTNEWTEHCRGLISATHDPIAEGVNIGFDDNLYPQSEEATTSPTAAVTFDNGIAKLYKELAELGLEYGLTFQNIVDVSASSGKARAFIKTPDTKRAMPFNYESRHLIHPATMDSCFQALFPALSSRGPIRNIYIPTFVEELYISSGLAEAPTSGLVAHAEAYITGLRDAEATISVIRQRCPDTASLPLLHLTGLKCTALDNQPLHSHGDEQLQRHSHQCFKSMWEPDVDLLSKMQADEVVTNRVCLRSDRDRVEDRERVAAHFISQTLRKVKVDDTRHMLSHHKRLYDYIKEADECVTALADAGSHSSHHKTSFDIDAVVDQIDSSGPEGQLLCKIGRNLYSILSRDLDPLALMAENSLLSNYYAEANWLVSLNAQMAQYINLISYKNPNLHILEVGAGTGGSTKHILKTLGGYGDVYPRFASYTYTDITAGFFENAETEFADWRERLKFRKLDIERTPEGQGFEVGSYDVVIAANVLHVAQDVSSAVANVRQLLRPGGKLIMIEITQSLLAHTLIFGTLPGWWSAVEAWRQQGPTLSEHDWSDVLKRNGFSHLRLSVPGSPDPKMNAGRLMVAEALRTLQQPARLDTATLIITSDVDDGASEREALYLQSYICSQQSGDVRIMSFAAVDASIAADKICICLAEIERPLIRDMACKDYAALNAMCLHSRSVIWITKGGCQGASKPELALVKGLFRSLRSENESLDLTTYDMDDYSNFADDASCDALMRVLHCIDDRDGRAEAEYTAKDGIVYIERYVEDQETNSSMITHEGRTVRTSHNQQYLSQPKNNLKLGIGTLGLLETLAFEVDPTGNHPLGPNAVELNVQAAALNFRDVMLCMGQVADTTLGLDCSGIVSRVGNAVKELKVGDHVCTWTFGTFQNYVQTEAAMVQQLPSGMSKLEAATIPVVWSTAYYALIVIARLSKGESVLIHAAAGGVGQAALTICQFYDADVFVTVGSDQKKQYLVKNYGIPEDRIFSSRDLSFKHGIKRATKGRGIDVILNSLSGEALRATWDCISPFGRFIEIGKKDIGDNTRLEMAPFARNATFASVDLLSIRKQRPGLCAEIFQQVMQMFRNGVVETKAPIHEFSFSQVDAAFRLMQSGKHIGKIVLVPNADDFVTVRFQDMPPLKFSSNVSYLIAGGLGGLGRSIAKWMALRGAKNIIFVSRSGAESKSAKMLLYELHKENVRTEVLRCDIASPEQLHQDLTSLLQVLPPLHGVVQAAMALEDSIFEHMPYESFVRALRPKVQGTWNLHHTTLGQPLDFFVMLSSVAGIVGSPSQSNYAAGNTFQDAFSAYRVSRGLPATTIDLGIIKSVGYVAEQRYVAGQKVTGNIARSGLAQMDEQEFLSVLEVAMRRGKSHQDCRVITGLSRQRDLAGCEVGNFQKRPAFSHVRKSERPSSRAAVHTEQHTHIVEPQQRQLDQTTSNSEAHDIILDRTLLKLSKCLLIDLKTIERHRSTSSYGIDSLVAAEMRNWITREFKADVPVLEILQAESISMLAHRIGVKSILLPLYVEARGR